MSKTRIAVITPAKFPGTAGDTANYTEIMNQMIAEGFAVSLICPKNNSPLLKNPNLSAGLEIIRIPSIPPRLQEMTNKPSFWNYFSALRFILIESLTVLWTLKRKRIKHVFMRHSLLTMQIPFLLRILGAKSAADGEIASDYFESTQMNSTILRLIQRFERRAIKGYSFFKVSTQTQAESLAQIGFPRDKLLLVPVSINTDNIPKFPLLQIPKHTFGYFGVLEKWQGVDLLLQAFQILVPRLPEAKLFIIGEGSLKGELQKTIERNGLANNVFLVGGVPRDELWNNYFTKFRVIVIPRPKQNNSMDFVLPIKLIESLASGKPIIAVDIPAMKDIPENTIFSIPTPDPELFASAMEKLSKDESLLARHSAASLAAGSRYDIRKHISKLMDGLVSD